MENFIFCAVFIRLLLFDFSLNQRNTACKYTLQNNEIKTMRYEFSPVSDVDAEE